MKSYLASGFPLRFLCIFSLLFQTISCCGKTKIGIETTRLTPVHLGPNFLVTPICSPWSMSIIVTSVVIHFLFLSLSLSLSFSLSLALSHSLWHHTIMRKSVSRSIRRSCLNRKIIFTVLNIDVITTCFFNTFIEERSLCYKNIT